MKLHRDNARLLSPLISWALLSAFVSCSLASLVVVDTGLRPLERDGISIIMFVTLENNSSLRTYRATVKPIMCCLKITRDDEDCDSVHIIESEVEEFAPRIKKDVTLNYPTVYKHDRFGTCILAISAESDDIESFKTSHIQLTIDTRIYGNSLSKRRKKALFKMYNSVFDTVKCDHIDDDPLNSCKPVDCDKKYDGFQPYFDHKSKRCVPAPVCISKLNKDLPDVAYVPLANACRDLERPFDAADVKFLSEVHRNKNVKRFLSRKNRSEAHKSSQAAKTPLLEGYDTFRYYIVSKDKREEDNEEVKGKLCILSMYIVFSTFQFIGVVLLVYCFVRFLENFHCRNSVRKAEGIELSPVRHKPQRVDLEEDGDDSNEFEPMLPLPPHPVSPKNNEIVLFDITSVRRDRFNKIDERIKSPKSLCLDNRRLKKVESKLSVKSLTEVVSRFRNQNFNNYSSTSVTLTDSEESMLN